MRASLLVLGSFFSLSAVAAGCGGDAADPDAGTAVDSGSADAGATPDSGTATDAGGSSDAASPSDGGGGSDAGGGADAGGSDAGGGGGTDGGGGPVCPCFGPSDIAVIEAHAVAGGTRGCMVGVSSGTFITGALSSTNGPQNIQVDVAEISGFAGVDWTCAAGCSDLNDDAFDDCVGAPLGPYMTMMVSEAQHDACEALIAAQCE
jgi:hypothetical protein